METMTTTADRSPRDLAQFRAAEYAFNWRDEEDHGTGAAVSPLDLIELGWRAAEYNRGWWDALEPMMESDR